MQVEDLLIKHTTENNTDKAAEFIQDKNTKDAGLRVSGTGFGSGQGGKGREGISGSDL